LFPPIKIHYHEAARAENRQRAKRWMDIGKLLGAQQVRIDSGGPLDLEDDVLAVIVDGYVDVIAYARERGLEVVIERYPGQARDEIAQRDSEMTMKTLWAAGNRSPWGIESIGLPGEEEAAALSTRRFMEDVIGGLMQGQS
jgi:hypothetical protein